jgi:hypothetical protein
MEWECCGSTVVMLVVVVVTAVGFVVLCCCLVFLVCPTVLYEILQYFNPNITYSVVDFDYCSTRY